MTDYSAASENELTLSKGEVVQIVGCSGSMFLVSRQMSSSTEQPAAGSVEGLVPCHVLTQKDVGDNGLRYCVLFTRLFSNTRILINRILDSIY